MRWAQVGCGRGHQFMIELDDNERPLYPDQSGCPECSQADLREQQKAALHSLSIKAAVLEALREFLPELVAALRDKP